MRTTPRSQVSSWLEFTQVSCPGVGRGRSEEEQGGNCCAVKHLGFNRIPTPEKSRQRLHEPIKPHLAEIYRSLFRKSQTLFRPSPRGPVGEALGNLPVTTTARSHPYHSPPRISLSPATLSILTLLCRQPRSNPPQPLSLPCFPSFSSVQNSVNNLRQTEEFEQKETKRSKKSGKQDRLPWDPVDGLPAT